MAARDIFLDTNGWFALLSADDSLHIEAEALWRKVHRENRPVVLTDWIVAETGNGLARTPQRLKFPEAIRRISLTPRVRFVFITSILMTRALELYEQRPDKTWGLVDCASFIVMSDEGITDAFTTDHHFAQAGFVLINQ